MSVLDFEFLLIVFCYIQWFKAVVLFFRCHKWHPACEFTTPVVCVGSWESFGNYQLVKNGQ